MARKVRQTQPCSKGQARQRFERARSFLEVAELAVDEADPDAEYGPVAASLAVLAGIAASDAACCMALGERSRSQNHHDAEALLEQLTPGGAEAAKALRELIDLEDTTHYGFAGVGTDELKRALRRARKLLDFADRVLHR